MLHRLLAFLAIAASFIPASFAQQGSITGQGQVTGAGQIFIAPPPAVPPTVSISPSVANMATSATQVFIATLTNDSFNQGVTWTLTGAGCSGATCGTLSQPTSKSGVPITYTAPSGQPSPNLVVLTATSILNPIPASSASVNITVTAPPPPVVVRNTCVPGSQTTAATNTFSCQASLGNAVEVTVYDSTGTTVTGVTAGGIALTQVCSAATCVANSGGIQIQKWYGMGLPTGITTYVVSNSPATSSMGLAVMDISNIVALDTAAFTGGIVSPTTAPVGPSLTTTAADIIIPAIGVSGSTTAIAAPFNLVPGVVFANGLAYAISPLATTFTPTWTMTSGTWAGVTAAYIAGIPSPVISVSIAPTTASVQVNTTASFTPTVNNDSQGVNWTLSGAGCSGATCGTLSSSSTGSGVPVTYTAPAAVPSPATVTLTATSITDATKTATTTITVTSSAIIVAVSPGSSTVQTNGTQTFSCTVTNDAAAAGCDWALTGAGCSGATCGSLSVSHTASGVALTYTGPAAVPSPATVTLTAASTTDASKTAAATITVIAAPAIVVSVSPGSANVQTTKVQAFSCTVVNDAGAAGCDWALTGAGCSGATCGTLSTTHTASGVTLNYTGPASVPSPVTVTLTATSTTDGTKSAAATITLSSGPILGVVVAPGSASVQTAHTQAFTATVANDAGNRGVDWTLAGLSGAGPTIPVTFYGMNNDARTGAGAYPTFPIGGIRLWDPLVTGWAGSQTGPSTYDFTQLNARLSDAPSNVDIMWTAGCTPNFIASSPGSTTPCQSNTAGSASVPSDVTTTDATWKGFITALVNNSLAQTHHIKYYEMNNEADLMQYCFNGAGLGNTKCDTDASNVVTMVHDAYTIIHALDPNALVVSPTGSTTCTNNCGVHFLPAFFAAGGAPYIDIVGMHSYMFNVPTGGQFSNVPEQITNIISQLRALMVTYSITGLPLWFTEGSWGGGTNNTNMTDDQKVAYIGREYLLMRMGGIARNYWYAYGNSQWGTLSDGAGNLTKAGIAMSLEDSWLVGATDLPGNCTQDGSLTWQCYISHQGSPALIIWNPTNTPAVAVNSIYTSYLTLDNANVNPIVSNSITAGPKPVMAFANLGTLSTFHTGSGTPVTYTAPTTVPSPATVTIAATSTTDPTKSASSTITVLAAPAIVVSVSPGTATLAVNATQAFTPTVTNDVANAGVDWTLTGSGCSGATCGTLSSSHTATGVATTYTAPANVPSPATVTITATSTTDNTKSASSTITITIPPNLTIAVAPGSASVTTNGVKTFTATLTNDTSNQGATWSLSGGGCSGATCGTVSPTSSASGVAVTYTAPGSVPSPATVTITATSVTAPSKTATATITVTSPVITVTVAPTTATLQAGGQTQTFTATVANSGSGVNWTLTGSTCTGATCGTLSASTSASGVPITYTSPASNVSETVTLTATSIADGTKTASATINVNANTTQFSCAGVPCPAFPGAQGGGAASVGGRGGAVYNITTNADTNNPGCLSNSTTTCSLRDCVFDRANVGARTCIFRVAGIFPVTAGDMRFSNALLTVACQSAPGEVILGGPTTSGALFWAGTHDVIMRYCTLSPDTNAQVSGPNTGSVSISITNCSQPSNASQNFPYSPNTGCYNQIYDHITTRWSGNKSVITTSNFTPDTHSTACGSVPPGCNAGDGPNHNITVQWSLDYEPHEGHPVGFGTATDETCQGFPTGPCLSPLEVNIDFHHDMLVNVDHRIPENSNQSSRWINNIVYNWSTYANQWLGAETVDVINNKFIQGNLNSGTAGPGGCTLAPCSGPAQAHPIHFTANSPELCGPPSGYVSGNIYGASGTNTINSNQWGNLTIAIAGEDAAAENSVLNPANEWCLSPTGGNQPQTSGVPVPGAWQRTSPMAASNGFPIVPDPATSLDTILPPTVGNSQHLDCTGNQVAHRDGQDQRIVAEYQNGTSGGFWPNGVSYSGFIYCPPGSGAQCSSPVTPIPTIQANWKDNPVTAGFPTCTESLHDGIPDQWKTLHGLSTTNANLYNTTDTVTGLTYLEDYLDQVPPGVAPVAAASCSVTDVQNALNSAPRNATVTVPSGSCNWASQVTSTKGVKLTGAGAANTIITNTGGNITMLQITPDATAVANDETIKVEGFTFDGGGNQFSMIGVTGTGDSAAKPFNNLVIYNNTFRHGNSVGGQGDNAIQVNGQVRGVISTNTFAQLDFPIRVFGNDTTTEFNNSAFDGWQTSAHPYGTSDQLFFENNTIHYTGAYTSSQGAAAWTETGQGGRLVQRFNTWNLTNLTASSGASEFWDAHGFQAGGQTGTMMSEYYDNAYTNIPSSVYRWVFFRGVWGVYFDNTYAGASSPGIELSQYDPGPPSCTNPGVNSGIWHISNTYFFNNLVNGTLTAVVNGNESPPCPLTQNVDYWNQNTSFTGATGIGRGLKSALPATCTIGVGFWVTNEGSWNTNLAANTSGQFYKCTSTNTWTLYYTPYTYPHPLAVP